MRTSEKKLDGNLTVPGFLFPLFWDCRPEHVQVDIHADFVMARVMERGTWEAMRWLLRTYSKDRLISFLEKKGRRTLPPPRAQLLGPHGRDIESQTRRLGKGGQGEGLFVEREACTLNF